MSCHCGAREGWIKHYTAGATGSSSVSGVDSATWPKLVQLARAVGANPLDWAAVMMAESEFTPTAAAHTKAGSIVAVGLNQLSLAGDNEVVGGPHSTFEGVTGLPPTQENAQAFLALPASKQLDATAKFWGALYKRYPKLAQGGARDLYWVNFLPASYVQGVDDDFVIPNVPSWAKSGNRGLVDSDGQVRAGGFLRALNRAIDKKADRWAAIVANVNAADDGPELVSFSLPNFQGQLPPLPTSQQAAAAAKSSAPAFAMGAVLLLGTIVLLRKRAA